MPKIKLQKNKWRRVKLGEICEFPPSVKLKKGGIYDCIAMENISGGFKFPQKIESKKYSGGAKFRNGDTIFARITPCLQNGKIVKVKGLKNEVGFGSTEYFVFRAIGNISDEDFIYYLAKSDLIKLPAIKSMFGASGRQRADKSVVENIEINIPPLPTQKKIASILSAYDDLIENNTKRIKILEETAQAIYKEWFVNFRFPGYEKVKMIDSGNEFGKVPEGWEARYLKDFVEFRRGIEPGSKNYFNIKEKGCIPFLRVGDLSSRDSNLFINEELAKGKIISRNDIVVTMDGTVGIVKMGFEGAYSTGIRKIIIKEERINYPYLFLLMQSEQIQDTIKAHAQGSTILHAGKSIEYMIFLLPDKKTINNFFKVANPILEEMLQLNLQNKNLRQTRDLLLPKLVSGEININ